MRQTHEMERVTGIGGFFFKADDPVALSRWYAEHLGVGLPPASLEDDEAPDEECRSACRAELDLIRET